MKSKLMMLVLFLGFVSACFGQAGNEWLKWQWLIGDWKGEGSGQPGEGEGTFSFTFDLDRNIIIRKSHSEYPATEKNSKVIHDDLMIVYRDPVTNSDKAVYFDNEGHKIFYTASFSDKSIILTSEKISDIPVFRLTYSLIDKVTVNTRFEMSLDGEKFMIYIEGKSKKTDPGH